jgi:hypothetical protein
MSKFGLRLRIDNIEDIHQDDLIIRLAMARHPNFDDKYVEDLVLKEIERRKENKEWDND